MKKKDDLITQLQYTIEANEDEIQWYEEIVESLQQDLKRQHARITELIAENDRLTLAYEPYVPPSENRSQGDADHTSCAGIVSVDLWPLTDWRRLSLNPWNPGHAFQICVGPLRVDWFED